MNIEKNSLVTYRKNIFSENGEDGIIEKIFSEIQPKSKLCCEFGAWDGIWASNCRNLIIKHGWNAIMIEGDPLKFQDLLKTYENNKDVRCVNNYVDNKEFSLTNILTEYEKNNMDLLSIDVDGFDYEIFESLDFYPQVICVEVNSGHSPDCTIKIPREIAKNNVGQPLTYFVNIAQNKGYELVCLTGNAFFIKKDLLNQTNIKPISARNAYLQHLATIPNHVKERLYYVNKGKVNPFYTFDNKYLTKNGLGLGYIQISKFLFKLNFNKIKNEINIVMKHIKNKLRSFTK